MAGICPTCKGPWPGLLKWNVKPDSSGRADVCKTCHRPRSQTPMAAVSAVKGAAVQGSKAQVLDTLGGPWKGAFEGENDGGGEFACQRCGNRCRSKFKSAGDWCCRNGCSGSSAPCSLCAKNRLNDSVSSYYGAGAGKDIMDVVNLVGIDGTVASLSVGDSRTRKQRIKSNTRRLFHQTSADVAKLIFSSQEFKRGSDGLAGGGIYFATTTEDTNHKKNPRQVPDPGPILSAEVLLGRVLTIDKNGDRSITFRGLLSRPGGPYDSVLIPRDNGHEYVVYNSDQVRNIRQAACRDGAGCTNHSNGHRKNYCHKQISQQQQQPKRQPRQHPQQQRAGSKPTCKYGSKCYRTDNPDHTAKYKH